jgi:hypothetical protein
VHIMHLLQDLTQTAIVDLDYQRLLSESSEIDIHCEERVPAAVQFCTLPVALCCQSRLVIAGLSSVLRQIILRAQQPCDKNAALDAVNINSLLGERSNCLKACAEVSPWTKFCEVTLPSVIQKFINGSAVGDVPQELVQLECHMAELDAQRRRLRCQARTRQKKQCTPVCRKQNTVTTKNVQSDGKLDSNDESWISVKSSDSGLLSEVTLDHLTISAVDACCNESPFVEGDCLQLTDLILFLYIELGFCGSSSLRQFVASQYHISRWFKAVDSIKCIQDAIVATGLPQFDLKSSVVNGTAAAVSNGDAPSHVPDKQESICLKEANRTSDLAHSFRVEIKAKFKASQFAITEVLQKLKEVDIKPYAVQLNNSTSLPWTGYPDCVLPSTQIGGVPDKRACRKLEQLENMVAAVMSVVQIQRKESYTIIDFCSGGGHLGIVLAYLLPNCQVRNLML